MSMLEYLEKDKESMINGLEIAQTPEKAQALIGEELDRLLLQYNQKCCLPVCREAAASMLQTARISSGLVDTVGEIRVWEEVPPAAVLSSDVPARSLKEKVFLAASLFCAAAALLLAILTDPDSFRAANLLLALLLGAASAALAYLAGKSAEKRTQAQTKANPEKGAGRRSKNAGLTKTMPPLRRTESRVDAQKIYTCLHNMIFAVDQNLNRLMALDMKNEEAGRKFRQEDFPFFETAAENGERTVTADSAIILFSDLLEAGYSADGEYALDKIGQVKFFLHQRGIETVDYDGDNGELFDFMPAPGSRTLRPALVRDGVLLCRGMAAGER